MIVRQHDFGPKSFAKITLLFDPIIVDGRDASLPALRKVEKFLSAAAKEARAEIAKLTKEKAKKRK